MIEAITYTDLTSSVVNAICNNCVNVYNGGSGIPSEMRAGYSSSTRFSTGTEGPRTATVTIASNAVSVVATSTVQSNFNSYINQIGQFSGQVTPNGLLTYLDAVVRFVAQNVVYVSSSLYQTNCIPVYRTQSISNPPVIELEGLIKCNTVNQLMTELFSLLKANTRFLHVTYSFTSTGGTY